MLKQYTLMLRKENVVEHDTQGNPVTLNMDDLSIQELVLFSRYSFAQKTAFEKAAREQQDKRSMESSIIRAQIDIDKNLQRIKEAAKFGSGLLILCTAPIDCNSDAIAFILSCVLFSSIAF